jgi:hypothetical protein
VFWGGIDNDNYGGVLYFSPTLLNNAVAENCYQANDPTSQDDSDLLPTDGGTLVIPDMGRLYKMVSLGPNLFLFASNGVWLISGSTGVGFTATDYQVSRISVVPSVGQMSHVVAEGAIYWWNSDGIYITMPSQNSVETAGWDVQSVTETTIKSFYKTISPTAVRYAKGAYDTINKTVQWVYSSEDPTGAAAKYTYNRAMNLRLVTQAFFPYDLGAADTYPAVRGLIYVKKLLES